MMFRVPAAILTCAASLLFGLTAFSGRADEPPKLTAEEQELTAQANRLVQESLDFHHQGKLAEAAAKMEESLEFRRQLYPASKYPNGHRDLASTLNNLGFLLAAQEAHDRALSCYQQALAMYRKLYPESKYPNGHADYARGLVNVGSLLRKQGAYAEALPYHEQAVAMYRGLYPESKYPNGQPHFAISLNNLGGIWSEQGEYERALPYYEQALAMKRKLYPASKYPDGHPDLATSLNNLGALFREQGKYENAMLHFEQALAMRRKLYPESKYPSGHPELATSLDNLGEMLRVQMAYEKALLYSRQGLAMWRKLYPRSRYPDGHPDLAVSLNNLGTLLQDQGMHGEALACYERALAMQKKFYSESTYADGHPDLATSLNNLGALLYNQGAFKQALPYCEQALSMRRKLCPASKYPDGHPLFAISLNNLGNLLRDQGEREKALPYLEQALAMRRKLVEREIGSASESQALALFAAVPDTQHCYHSAAVFLPDSGPASYDATWTQKGTIMRLLTQRHLAAAVQRTASAEMRRQFEHARELRGEIARLLLNPGKDLAARDQRLATLSGERDRLERDLAKLLPALERDRELARLRPDALISRLPPDTAFIDFVQYGHWEDGKYTGARYLVFVLARGQPIRRIELGAADSIDRAVANWRKRIERRAGGEEQDALAKLVWQPIAKHLPRGTRTLYISPDGDLARLPWCALPGSKPDTVLLEEFEGGIAVMPNGSFLLEQLMFPPKFEGAESWLTLGAVDYGTSRWPTLPGAEVELKALAALGPSERETLHGTDATVTHLTEALAKVRCAHLATHGFFDADTLSTEMKREAKARKNRRFGDETRPVAAQNPLGFTGLVLSHGEVVTGLSLVDLPLEKLKLVTLSACDTGLGELTGGEGVQGLQRAFHLAGCPNVVASLWQISDAATAALMAKFYFELWVNKKPPIEALREAQLTIYRRPDLIPALAGERGAPKLKDAVAARVIDLTGANATRLSRADTKLWAAFVLSGVGK